jgi:hypothetical protein
MSNNHNAVGGTFNAINDSNNCNAVGGSDDDIMSLSCTNQSLQPNVSASDSSSFFDQSQSPMERPLKSQEVQCWGGFIRW